MKSPYCRRLPTRPLIFTALLAALVPAAVRAQSAAEDTAAKEETIVLSPFGVTTARDVGYVANNTLAGSRLRTNLNDVANAVSVLTPEFISDIGAFSENDVMRYSASAVAERTDQTPAVQGIAIDRGGFQFRIRGQVASRSRNYFGSSLIPDTYNAERFEEARGPNAILFGLGGAGGILNSTTKTARLTKTFTHLNLTAGSDNLLRSTIDHNQKLNDKLALRVNGVYQTGDGWQEHQFNENRRLHFAGTYRPREKITLRVEAEYGHVQNTLARFYAPFDNATLWKTSGAPLVASGTAAANNALGIGRRNANQRVTFIGNDDSFHNFRETVFSIPGPVRNNSVFLPGDWAAMDSVNLYPDRAAFSGPGGRAEYHQKLFAATLELEPLKNLFIELAAVNDRRDHQVYDTTHEAFRVTGEPGRTFRDGAANPYAGLYYVDTRWVSRFERIGGDRYRATASYPLNFGKLGRHNLAAMASRDYTAVPRYVAHLVMDGAPFHSQPHQANNFVWTRQYITDPSDLSQYAAPDFRRIPKTFSVQLNPNEAPRTFNTAWANNELNDQWEHTDNTLASLQSYFLDDRIVTTAGWRYTKQANFSRPTNATLPSFATSPLVFLDEPVRRSVYDFERVSYGIVAKPTKWLSLYYNYSENAQIPGTTQTLIPDASPFPLNTGEGKDYGAMFSLLNGRLFVRAGYFTTASVDQAAAFGASNVARRNARIMDAMVDAGLIQESATVRFAGGDFDLADLATDGYEVNITANPLPGWRVMFNLSQSESVQTNMLKRSRPAAAQVVPLWQDPRAQALLTSANISVAEEIANYNAWLASTTAVENEGTVGHRDLEARAFTRYEIQKGSFRGLFFGGGFSYGSSPVIGRSAAGELFYAPIRREADALLGYRTRLPDWLGRAPIEFQFNATNLLQRSPYTLVRRNPDGQIFRAVLNPPTTYTFGTRISF